MTVESNKEFVSYQDLYLTPTRRIFIQGYEIIEFAEV